MHKHIPSQNWCLLWTHTWTLPSQRAQRSVVFQLQRILVMIRLMITKLISSCHFSTFKKCAFQACILKYGTAEFVYALKIYAFKAWFSVWKELLFLNYFSELFSLLPVPSSYQCSVLHMCPQNKKALACTKEQYILSWFHIAEALYFQIKNFAYLLAWSQWCHWSLCIGDQRIYPFKKMWF